MKLSKVRILLKCGEWFEFIIKSKDKEKTLKGLIKNGEILILEHDFAIFESENGRAVVNISQIEAFSIEDIREDI